MKKEWNMLLEHLKRLARYAMQPLYKYFFKNNTHICELTCIEQVSPAFQTFYSHRKCWLVSSAFLQCHPP